MSCTTFLQCTRPKIRQQNAHACSNRGRQQQGRGIVTTRAGLFYLQYVHSVLCTHTDETCSRSAGNTSRYSGHPLRYERAPEPTTSLAIYAPVAAEVDVIAAASLPAAHIVAYFNSDATTDLTLRRFRSTYVCPQPAVIEGLPIRSMKACSKTCWLATCS